ncbi:MAG: FAD-binding oxidoreductase [Chitinophagales bacterium]|nr:FAD-binding oxidoreductase [Bacteroidota bacterium]MCB9043589.1 FAD-binding oxidoreductase [Chitinophagales bacterium]
MKYDLIIVGQGIAGTAIAAKALEYNKKIILIDERHKPVASEVAAGVINPLTGKNWGLAWEFENAFAEAQHFYQYWETFFHTKFLRQKPIKRYLAHIGDQNTLAAFAQENPYQKYVQALHLSASERHTSAWKNTFGSVDIFPAAHINTQHLLATFRQFFSEKNMLCEEQFCHEQLTIFSDKVIYKDMEASFVVFCEGYKVLSNPLFARLPINACKGEVLLAEIDELDRHFMYKCGVMAAPQSEKIWWIGSTYHWNELSETPNLAMLEELRKLLQENLLVPYKIQNMQAGIRPGSPDRRPIVGNLKEYPPVTILNGLGTKAYLYAPLMAHFLAKYLFQQENLPPTIALSRFKAFR